MKLAYLIMAHTDPAQLKYLTTALDTDNSYFFIHVDKKSEIELFLQAKGQNVVFLQNRIKAFWGGYSLAKVPLMLMQTAVESSISFDYYILLTGVCYPIKSNEYIESFFRSTDREYIDYFKLPGRCWKKGNGGLNRIKYYHFNDLALLNPRSRKAINKIARRCFNNFKRLFPRTFFTDITPYGGHAYYCLTHDCVRFILNFLEQNKKFVSFYKKTKFPEEMIFQTILLNSPFRTKIENNSLRFVLWSREDPAILDERDIEAIKKTDALFARKFHSQKSSKLRYWIDKNVREI